MPISDLPDEILAMIIDFASLQSPQLDFDIVLRSYSFARELALIRTLEFGVDVICDQSSGLSRLDDVQIGLPWSLIRSVGQHLRELAHLQLQGYFSRLNLRDVVKYVPLTSLEVLQVKRAGEIEFGAACVEPEDYRTAPFKRLDFYDISASPDTVNQLIQWSKELVSFSLEQSLIYGADLPMLHSWLSSHRDTLKEIKIDSVSVKDTGTLFNAAHFPNLETFQLPRWVMGPVEENRDRPVLKWSPDQADLLLGPKLYTFTWLFEDDGIHRLEWHEFSDQEESWLRSLMKEAIARKSALRKIRIQFYPDMESAQPQEYPWDRMDDLREEFEPYGLTLEYCDPPVTKSEWQVMFDESFNPFDVSSEPSDTEA
ncbi:hypothetical protein BDW42DRAFT_199689 [Aspergillus taichungensis]|uniref:F-box domain-containing protein n=1 Tax=Aspergillus taichungensis TaxID=482145 RepID=A0A2J5HDN3_9EURO|nr:hypothetical protein BDW42DRAFT_199689 [Aspergillus taichungensis]